MVATDEPEVIVPLVAPSPEQLRAGAVWVTISNWADALSQRYGAAEIVTPASIMTPADARHGAFQTQGPVPTTSDQPELASEWPKRTFSFGTVATNRRQRRSLGNVGAAGKPSRPAARRLEVSQHSIRVAAPRLVRASRVWAGSDVGRSAGPLRGCSTSVGGAPMGSEPTWVGSRRRTNRRDSAVSARPISSACVSSEVADEVSRLSAGRARVLVTPLYFADPADG